MCTLVGPRTWSPTSPVPPVPASPGVAACPERGAGVCSSLPVPGTRYDGARGAGFRATAGFRTHNGRPRRGDSVALGRATVGEAARGAVVRRVTLGRVLARRQD